jgi:hypothetical protein
VTDDEVRAELAQVEQELAGVRQAAAELRQQVGDDNSGPTDPEDRAAGIAEADEQDNLAASLEQRRDALRARLGGG